MSPDRTGKWDDKLVLPAERSLWDAYKSWLFSAVVIALIGVVGLMFNTVGEPTIEDDPPPPIITEAPGWLVPLEPLGRLPLWGQAAVISAGFAGLFFVIPMIFRWVWRLGEEEVDADEEDEASDDPEADP